MTQQHDPKEDSVSEQTAVAPDSQVEEVEVEFRPGVDEDASVAAEYDQKPLEEKEEVVEEVKDADILDTIVPRKEPRVWVIGEGTEMERTYVQKELSFLAKMQWFSLVGEALDKALSGPSGMSLNSLFSAPGMAQGQLRMDQFRDADMFVQAISKLLSAMPDFLLRSYLIWLNVPDYDREIVEDLMKLPPEDGGLSDDQGMEMIETFLDQNYEALASFFGERLGQLQARISKLNEARASRR